MYASASRGMTTNYNAEPFDIYRRLKQPLESSCTYYINGENAILFGSSQESIRVGGKEKIAEIAVVGRKNPRGVADGNIDNDLDNKHEAELKLDSEEIARHTMLVDLARNCLSQVCKAGSRHAYRLYYVKKSINGQYLVSNIKGVLRDDLDALHVYLAAANMQLGAPQTAAIKILRQHEKTKIKHYGSLFCITPSSDFKSMMTKAIKLKNNKAYFRAEADVFYDSITENKFKESDDSAKVMINAIKLAGGLK